MTDEQRMLQESVRAFVERDVRPHVLAWDEAQEFPAEAVRTMGAAGFLGTAVPEQWGGAGLGALEFIVVMEELARVDPSLGLTLAAHSGLCLQHLVLFANDEQAARTIPALATGDRLGAWCLTEPGSGSDASGMRTTAVREGESYVLNGSKVFITNGSVASTYVVMAKTDASVGTKGISAFIVDRSMPGVIVGKKENKLGMRASDTVQMTFEQVRVPAANRLGGEGEGFTQALTVLDSGRIGIAALSIGLAQGALDAALRYARERKQFGKALTDFQGIQFHLAAMATELSAARLLTRDAAERKMRGEPITVAASQAKYFASEAAQRIATTAVQIHGGYGFTKDYPVEKFYRDAKLLTIGEGTSEVQKMVIAKNVLR
jgi:alkylation response protein AidB-like acyl-CoA dehydrogenase